MAEKYLKGFLVFSKIDFPKIHHLDRLIVLCQKVDSQFEKLRTAAENLSEFYIWTRYPGDYRQFSFEQAQKAFREAIKIKNFVLKRII